MDKKLIKHRYVESFGVLVIVLALLRCAFDDGHWMPAEQIVETAYGDELVAIGFEPAQAIDGGKWHRIRSVSNFKTAFPDTNDTQLRAARRWGVKPVKDREDAEERKNELVYIGASPYFHVDPLRQSIPYLVPRAAVLLQDIGKAFMDSLYIKGVPLNKIIVTSVCFCRDKVN